jgi:hypothetical protein
VISVDQLHVAFSDFVCGACVWCGQKEARETMKLLKMLPSDVYTEILEAVFDSP